MWWSGGKRKLESLGRTIYQASRNFDRDGCFDHAAYISYFALLSLLPLAILLVALGAAAIGSVDAAEKGAQFLLKDLMSLLGKDVFARAREVGSQAGRFGWPFFFLALWTASKVFSKVEQALDHVFQVEKRRSFPARKIFAFGLVALLVLLLVVMVAFAGVVNAFNRFLETSALAGTVSNPLYVAVNSAATRYLIPWLVSVFTFSFVYKVLPATWVPTRAAVVAGVVSGTLWEGLKNAFTLYVGRFANYRMTYGALETVVVFAVWINLSAALLLWGAELAAVLAGARGEETKA
ncbi:MAG TPA: YihY/virulence factor BrkB family protein [Vicinamibacteria bacterium]|nr:YihY/virulence factor BrkB family protein [Vicinamibacteria bacterium]